MNKVLLFLALSMGLQAHFAQSMEQAPKASLISKIQNSRLLQAGITIASITAAHMAAELIYDRYIRPTPPAPPIHLPFAELKEKVITPRDKPGA
jgi:hypothetical protein